ncbi:MAG: hypothetical protein FJ398_22950 [Verrucomicrobia bacterium]|nr:hypothetical protein [Verrucomicrobiota bacterium]
MFCSWSCTISDAWSLNLLFDELARLYEVFANKGLPRLPPPPLQYSDFAAWQRQRLRGAVLEKQLAYWMRELEGVPNLLELPADRPRPSVQTYAGAHESASVPRELADALKTLSQREGVTLFMTTLAILQALLPC